MSQSQASFYTESFINLDLQSDDLPDIQSSQLTVTSFSTSHSHTLRKYLLPLHVNAGQGSLPKILDPL